jgi:hypothetical protein
MVKKIELCFRYKPSPNSPVEPVILKVEADLLQKYGSNLYERVYAEADRIKEYKTPDDVPNDFYFGKLTIIALWIIHTIGLSNDAVRMRMAEVSLANNAIKSFQALFAIDELTVDEFEEKFNEILDELHLNVVVRMYKILRSQKSSLTPREKKLYHRIRDELVNVNEL